ncbi:MAG: hypothetical protein FWF10_11650 [Clostridiales bacterium]|nr:hypothetical protein [Clostridiales bacterium]
MKRANLLNLALFITIITCFSNCAENPKERVSMETQDAIIAIADNTTAKELIITDEYPRELFLDVPKPYGLTMVEINEIMPIQCMRKIAQGYYAVFRSVEGGWFYLGFESNDSGVFIAKNGWYYEIPVQKTDFSNLIIGESTLENVREIDPFGLEYISPYTGMLPCSIHQTIDGFFVEVRYRNGIVEKIIYEQRDHVMSNYILPIDM